MEETGKNGLWATEQKPSLVARIPAWLIHSFGPSFIAFFQAAWWQISRAMLGMLLHGLCLGGQLVSGHREDLA